MEFIKKLFIKDYKNIEDKNVRFRYGVVAGIIGIISNLILFLTKIFIGFVSASITIIADAINNLSDMASSCIVIFGFKLSSKPADSEHPFGHERYEQIMALIVAVIVTAIGILLAKSSIEKIISPEDVLVNIWTYIILVASILIKFFQMMLYNNFAKTINSKVLKASSIDSRNDIITTSSVLLAIIIIDLVGDIGFSIDGIFGLIVSMFIIISSFNLLKEAINPLLGERPNEEFVEKLRAKILSYDGVLGIHDFVIHSYGANKFFANVHVEVSSKVDVMISHDLIDNIERDFKENLNIDLSIHMDPIEVDNEEVSTNKARVEEILRDIDPALSLHDFRMVIGETHTNILFDVVVPFDNNITLQEINDVLTNAYIDMDKKYYFVITLDRE